MNYEINKTHKRYVNKVLLRYIKPMIMIKNLTQAKVKINNYKNMALKLNNFFTKELVRKFLYIYIIPLQILINTNCNSISNFDTASMQSNKSEKGAYSGGETSTKSNISTLMNLKRTPMTLIESIVFNEEEEKQYRYYNYGTNGAIGCASKNNQNNNRNELEIIEKYVYSGSISFITEIRNCCKENFTSPVIHLLDIDQNTKCVRCNEKIIDHSFFSTIANKIYCGDYKSNRNSCARSVIIEKNRNASYAYSFPIFPVIDYEDIIKIKNSELRDLNKMKNYLLPLCLYYEPIYKEKLKHISTDLLFCTSGTSKYDQTKYNKTIIEDSLPKLCLYIKNIIILLLYKKISNLRITNCTITKLLTLGIPQLSELSEIQNVENLTKVLIMLNFATDDEIQKLNKDNFYENYWNIFLKNNHLFANKLEEGQSNIGLVDPLTKSKSLHNENHPFSHIVKDLYPILICEELDLYRSYLIISQLKNKKGAISKNLEFLLKQHLAEIKNASKEEINNIIEKFNPEIHKTSYKEEEDSEKSTTPLSIKERPSILEDFSEKNENKDKAREIIPLCPRRVSSQRKIENSKKNDLNATEIETLFESNERNTDTKRQKIFSVHPNCETSKKFKTPHLETRVLSLNIRPKTLPNENDTNCAMKGEDSIKKTERPKTGLSNKTERQILRSSSKKTDLSEETSQLNIRQRQIDLELNCNEMKTEYSGGFDCKKDKIPNNYTDYEPKFTKSQWTILVNEFGSDINANLFLNENPSFTKKIINLPKGRNNSLFILIIVEARTESTKTDKSKTNPTMGTNNEIEAAPLYQDTTKHQNIPPKEYNGRIGTTQEINFLTGFSTLKKMEHGHISESILVDPYNIRKSDSTALKISMKNREEIGALVSKVKKIGNLIEAVKGDLVDSQSEKQPILYPQKKVGGIRRQNI